MVSVALGRHCLPVCTDITYSIPPKKVDGKVGGSKPPVGHVSESCEPQADQLDSPGKAVGSGHPCSSTHPLGRDGLLCLEQRLLLVRWSQHIDTNM